MKKTHILNNIRAMLPELSDAERKFADYILQENELIYKSITMVTEESGAGYGTIIRLCQKLKCKGFQDFKIKLALELAQKETETPIAETTFFSSVCEDIRTVNASIDPLDLDKTVKLLRASKKILVIGSGGSYAQAWDLCYRLIRLGFDATVEGDSHLQAIRASTLKSSDVLIAVSFSGSTKGILHAVKQGKKGKASVIAITNYARSPLGNTADLTFCLQLRSQVLDAEIGSKIPVSFLIEVLCYRLFKSLPKAVDTLSVTAHSVSDKLF
ncbi:MurR/RpiR family transcriptional regulator [Treponema sp. OMZ 840]|uniref:MurR/RpiR family transcriptional regulator n=1 Tax=Treponema sp. OMZ 840 TaxID=244313 RepID=UPI003D8F0FC8